MRPRSDIPAAEQGAALLSILLLVAILSVIAATTLDRVILSTKLAGNGQAVRQARAMAFAAEDIALARIADLRAADATQTTLAGNWMGTPRRFPMPGGTVTATVRDGGNCFNLNSLVQEDAGSLKLNAAGRDQFLSLMAALSIPENTANSIAAAAIDWIDTDNSPQPGGAEDGDYQSAPTPFLPANQLFVHKSELLAIKSMSAPVYARLSPFVCALPKAELSPLNVNTLLPEQVPLLAMLFPQGNMSANNARSYLAKRPASGYGSLIRFWDGLGSQAAKPAQIAQDQVKLTSTWFMLELVIESGDIELRETALIAADTPPPRLIWRSWGEAG
jgi:general secretion pathway protein K